MGGATSSGGTNQFGGSHAGGASAASVYTEPVENVDLDELPPDVPKVALEVSANAIATLDANPYDADDVNGAFTDASQIRYEPVDVNYRGAYALQTLMRYGHSQRNWKIKFAKERKYRQRREWNYTYEPHLREKLAYDLMRFAGVKVPSARHVQLSVNGTVSGTYLEYEDPDNKSWLSDKFGDDSGDLFKAAYDIPGETQYFATFEYLGDSDADYELHYRKMTNNDDSAKASDFSSLRVFLAGLNQTEGGGVEAYLRKNFDTDKFISYLVVANFVSNWDSYPQRPKNFWLYYVPAARRWVFIPWDMDGTFQPTMGYLDAMGTTASIFCQFDKFEDYEGRSAEEGTARPLVTRMMAIPSFRAAYVARYRQALGSFLDENYLSQRVKALAAVVEKEIPETEKEDFNSSVVDIQQFIQKRSANVKAELEKVP
jgi:spore coat protein H